MMVTVLCNTLQSKTFSFLLFIHLTLISYSQSQNISPSVHYNSLNEIGGGINIKSRHNFTCTVDLGIVIPVKKEMYYLSKIFNTNSFNSPFLQLAHFGSNLRASIIFGTNADFRNNFLSLFVDGGYNWSNKFIYDPGRSGGSNTDFYSEFKEQMSFLGFGIRLISRIADQTPFYATIGSGLKFKNIHRDYIVEQNYLGTYPSEKSTKYSKVSPSFTVGVTYVFQKNE